MKVLIGIDGSQNAYAAVRFVGRLLKAERDEVVFYYSLPPVKPSWHRRCTKEVVAQARKSLAEAVFREAMNCLPELLRGKVTEQVGEHDPRHGILVAADECRADVIALGARGTEAVRKAVLGSVARAVLHAATTPVLIVRPPVPATGETMRVLVAIDSADSSKEMSDCLNRINWPERTLGQVITVVESPWAGEVPLWLHEELENHDLASLGFGQFSEDESVAALAREQVHLWCGTMPSFFLGQEPLVAVGHAAQKILGIADQERADLIVVGARRLGTLGRLYLGSTSEQVVTNASCSVLVVRQHERP